MIYRFISSSTLRHDKLVNTQKEKQLKVLDIPQLSDTRWVCRYLAVNVWYGCLVEVLEKVIENSGDRTEAAEATGILAQIQQFFLILLTTFNSILGLTKPLSDALQVKHLHLSAVFELVDSII